MKNNILKYNTNGKSLGNFLKGRARSSILNFDFDKSGGLYLVDRFGIVHLDKNSNTLKEFANNEEVSPYNWAVGIAVSPLNGKIYVTDGLRHRVLEFSSTGQLLKVLPKTGMLFPIGIDVSPDGKIYVCSNENDLLTCYSPKGKTLWTKKIRVGLGVYIEDFGGYSGPIEVTYLNKNRLYIVGERGLLLLDSNGNYIKHFYQFTEGSVIEPLDSITSTFDGNIYITHSRINAFWCYNLEYEAADTVSVNGSTRCDDKEANDGMFFIVGGIDKDGVKFSGYFDAFRKNGKYRISGLPKDSEIKIYPNVRDSTWNYRNHTNFELELNENKTLPKIVFTQIPPDAVVWETSLLSLSHSDGYIGQTFDMLIIGEFIQNECTVHFIDYRGIQYPIEILQVTRKNSHRVDLKLKITSGWPLGWKDYNSLNGYLYLENPDGGKTGFKRFEVEYVLN